MKNDADFAAEVFRRGETRLRTRGKRKKQALLCLPAALCAVVALTVAVPRLATNKSAPAEHMQAEDGDVSGNGGPAYNAAAQTPADGDSDGSGRKEAEPASDAYLRVAAADGAETEISAAAAESLLRLLRDDTGEKYTNADVAVGDASDEAFDWRVTLYDGDEYRIRGETVVRASDGGVYRLTDAQAALLDTVIRQLLQAAENTTAALR